jgi:hypothetical protein
VSRSEEGWFPANQRALMAELAVLRQRLEQAAATEGGAEALSSEPLARALEEARAALPAPSALEVLCRAFSLSPFERALVLLSAGVELDEALAARCAALQGDPRKTAPTPALALALLPEPHWSALSPEAPLRRFQLLEREEPRGALMASPLRVAERVLHHLVGLRGLDERLVGLLEPLPLPEALPPSRREVAERVAHAWTAPGGPVLQVVSAEATSLREVAAAACALRGLEPWALRVTELPSPASEHEALCRLLEREALLCGRAVLVDLEGADASGAAHALSLAERLRTPVLVLAREPLRAGRRPLLRVEVPRLESAELKAVWEQALGPLSRMMNGALDAVLSQFPLSPSGIRAASAELTALAARVSPDSLGEVLWDACRAQARPRLEGLAQRIEPQARWDDLVLPAGQLEILRGIPAHVRQRARVYEAWGFGARGPRGLGLSALFCGPSGTGKTLAAEVLAAELRVDLYRIDLSQVVDKYIGETEKNLRRLFDAAEESGALLLFDEADALFGKRSEVRDSHDRHANIEVSYLLQRMEAYRGLAILTTNMRDALDVAFLRRIRFVVEFPFPAQAQRVELWRRAFPKDTPTERLDVELLARLGLSGGNIRNIALTAAFLAADANESVRMAHLQRAARIEYAKLERPLSELEGAGWE